MTAALVVIAVVAFLAILALVLMARRTGARLDAERARADRYEARVRALEEAAPASDAGPAPTEPALLAGDTQPPSATPTRVGNTQPQPATPVPLNQPEAEPPTAPAPPIAVPPDQPAATVAEPPTAPAPPIAVPPDQPAATVAEPPTAPSPPIPVPPDQPAATVAEPPTAPVAEPAGASAGPERPAAGAEPPLPVSAGPAPLTATAPAPADRVDTNSQSAVAAEPLLELERLRLEREWADIVGASTPLPVPWDGSVRSVVAVELDIIREVIGTPSRIEPGPTSRPAEPAAAVATVRLATEILRRLAKSGEEITVTFATDTEVTMAIAVEGNEVKPDLSDLTTTAAELGGRVTFLETDEGFEAQLSVPSQQTESASTEHQPDSRPS